MTDNKCNSNGNSLAADLKSDTEATVQAHTITAESIMPTLSRELFPPVITGLLVVVLLAAIMSTVDSLLILISSAITRDLVQKILKPDIPDKQLAKIGRIATLVIGWLGFIFAWYPHHPIEDRVGRYVDTRVAVFPGSTVLVRGHDYHALHHLFPRVVHYKLPKLWREIGPEMTAKGVRTEGRALGSTGPVVW